MMEQDRYQQDHALYIVGIVCLVLSLGLLIFGMYLLPFLLFKWVYQVPGFVLSWREWLISSFQFGDTAAAWIIFTIILFLAVVTAIIADISSNRIDNKIYGIKSNFNEETKDRIKQDAQETANIFSKVVISIFLILVAIGIFQWLIYVPPPSV